MRLQTFFQSYQRRLASSPSSCSAHRRCTTKMQVTVADAAFACALRTLSRRHTPQTAHATPARPRRADDTKSHAFASRHLVRLNVHGSLTRAPLCSHQYGGRRDERRPDRGRAAFADGACLDACSEAAGARRLRRGLPVYLTTRLFMTSQPYTFCRLLERVRIPHETHVMLGDWQDREYRTRYVVTIKKKGLVNAYKCSQRPATGCRAGAQSGRWSTV